MPEHQRQFALIRKRMFVITISLSAAFILAFGLATYSLVVSHDRTVQKANILCTAQNDTNDAIRKILLLAQTTESTKNLSSQERLRMADFYSQAYHLLDDVKCGGLT